MIRHPRPRRRLLEIPADARTFCFLLIASIVWPHAAAAQRVLSESDVIRLARSRSPASAVADATDALADAQARTAGRLPNPSVTWGRETVQSGPIGAQDIVTATLPVDLARPLARRSLVASRSAWMRAEASTARTQAVLEVLLVYYDLVLAKQRVRVLRQAVEHLEEAARILERREAAGSASGYESTRLAVARELGQSRLAEARGAERSARQELAALLGMQPRSLRVAAALSLRPAGARAFSAERGGSVRESVRQARASKRLAAEAEDRAGLTWLPALEVGAGVKHVYDLGVGPGTGYVIGLSLSIPVFDHGQALRAESEAARVLSVARAEALTRTLDAEARSARAVYRTARRELARFDAGTARQVETLLVAARSGYREGERSILELLDAQHAETQVAERRLGLLGAAKRAEARLRAATGDLK